MTTDETHFRKLERMYVRAPVNQVYHPEISITEGAAEISLQVKQEYFHAAHALHGAIYFKMLDDAAFFAANSVVRDTFVLTSSFNVHFFRPLGKEKITSRGLLRFSSKNLFVAEARLLDESGREAAFGTGNFVKSRQPLNPDIGYE